jgi:hypothetical protein
MARGILSDAKVRNAKPKAKVYRLSDGDGLYLFVPPSGVRSWQYRYPLNGKETIATLGKVTDEQGLAWARGKADKARAVAAEGRNVATEAAMGQELDASEERTSLVRLVPVSPLRRPRGSPNLGSGQLARNKMCVGDLTPIVGTRYNRPPLMIRLDRSPTQSSRHVGDKRPVGVSDAGARGVRVVRDSSIVEKKIGGLREVTHSVIGDRRHSNVATSRETAAGYLKSNG